MNIKSKFLSSVIKNKINIFILFFALLFSFNIGLHKTEAAITFGNNGTFQGGTGALTVPVPSTYVEGDLLLLLVESANEAIATPSGWTQVANSPQYTGTAASAGGVRVAAFYKIATASESSLSVADSGNHTTAVMLNFHGVNSSSPIDITAGSSATASTSMTFPTVTTTTANDMIVLVSGIDTDGNSTSNVSGWTNANLTSLTEIIDKTVNSGVGGGLGIATGLKATAGATGTTTATDASSVTHAYLTIALKPASVPTLSSTTAASSITDTTASSGGTISSNGGSIITSSGVVWNTTGTPTISDSSTTDGSASGTFTSSLTGLTCNTTYYVRAYATNYAGTGYASQISFTTSACVTAPVVTTQAVSSITQTTATGNGNVTSDGGASVTERGIVWNTSTGPTTANSKATASGTTGAYTASLTGLSSNTTYYVRAYAINSVGTSYGNEVSFTTLAPVNPNATSLTNTNEGTITDGARISQTIIITGTDFGTVSAGSRANCAGGVGTGCIKIGGTSGQVISDSNITSWTDTSITLTLTSADITSTFGGTTTSGLIVYAAGLSDTSGLTFYVYPNITSVTVPGGNPSDSAREGESITLNGTRFNTSGNQGTVTFTGNFGSVSATITSWSDTAVTLTVPTAIADNIYTGDITLTRTAATGSKTASAYSGGSSWYNASWSYRKKITIDGTKVQGTNSNFPILVSLTDSGLTSYANSSGSDIVFTSSDATTKLDYEIERFDKASGTLVAWVRIPSLVSGSNQDIYMYYGNASATDGQNKTGVWDTYYKGVWHLGDAATSTTISESTSNNLTSTRTDSTHPNVNASGSVGYGQSFEGTTSRIGVSGTTLNNLATTATTWEFWQNQNSTTVVMGKSDNNVNSGWFIRNGSPTNMKFERINATNNTVCAIPISASTWQHIVWVFNGDTATDIPCTDFTAYVNGSPVTITTDQSGVGATSTDASNPFYLGYNIFSRSTSSYFNGSLDEVRISSGGASAARSANWIKTEYNNQSSPSTFYSVSSQESKPASGSFRILPKIASISATKGGIGDTGFSITGDHLCQSGTCPTTFSANDKVVFNTGSVVSGSSTWTNTSIPSITIPAGATDGSLTIISNGAYTSNALTFDVKFAPSTPTNTTPANAATSQSQNPALTANAFSDGTDADTHSATLWQISKTSGDYTAGNLVWTRTSASAEVTTTVNNTNGTFTNTTLNTELNCNTRYYWHVKYKDNSAVTSSEWSAYSTETYFDTSACLVLPTVTTQAASNIDSTTVTGNGNITATGGVNNTKRGFVYGTTSQSLPGNVAPTSSGYTSYAEDTGSFTTGAFTKDISGLTLGLTYYMRAYSYNSVGYSYGDEVVFTTAPSPKNITISLSATTCTGSPNFITTTGSCNILNNDIQTLINSGTSVSITATNGDITVSNAVSKTSGADVTMSMYATENIIVNAAVTSTVGKLGLLLNSDRDANSSGYINISGNLTSNGGNITLGGGSGTISNGTGFAVGNAVQANGIFINTKTVAAGGGNIIVNGQGYSAAASAGISIRFAGSGITTTGSGTINIKGNGGAGTGNSRGLYMDNSAVISTVDGDLNVVGVGGGLGSDNAGSGLYITTSSTIKTIGSGNLSVTGTGGNTSGTGGSNYGIDCNTANCIQTLGTGTMTVTGTGGNGTSGSGTYNHGISISGSITGNGGAMTINGTGGASSGNQNYGIYITGASSSISNTGSGTLSVTGNGGGITNSGSNYGLYVYNGGIISTVDGNLTVNNSTGGGAGSGTQNHGVYVSSTGSTIKTTGSGNLSVTGTGGNPSGAGSSNYGINCAVANCIQTTGTGTMSVTGTGGNGSSGSGSNNFGIFISNGSITGNGGAMNINGTGGASNGSGNYGIYVNATSPAVISNIGSGTLSITGNGGGITNSGSNYGLYINSGGIISTVDGDLTVNGTGGGAGSGTANSGIYISGTGSTIKTTGSGNLIVNGIKGNGSSVYGISLEITNALQTTGSGGIMVNTDTIFLNQSNEINSIGSLTLAPYTAGTAVGIAGGSGTLNLSSAYLGYLTYGTGLTIGNSAQTGTITVGAYSGWTKPITFAHNATGSINITGAQTSTSSFNFDGPTALSAGITASNMILSSGTFNAGAQTINLTGTGNVFDYSGGTFTAGTSTIKLTDSSASAKTFAGGGQTYNNLWLAPGMGTGAFAITGNNTFNDFKDDGTGAHSIIFNAGSTTNISTLTLDADAAQLINLQSSTPGSYWNLVDTAGTNSVSYLSITDSCASGGATWSANNGTNTDGGHNCGWVFTSNVAPTLTTPTVTNITDTSAYLGANVTSLGSPATLTARGTCWGTTSNPTTNCEAEGNTTGGVFTQVRTGLTCNTTYYYRGYATNATGTNYSPDGTFTTSACSTYAWTAQINSGLRNWYSIASSADSAKMAAVVYGGYIYTSTDSGINWTEQTNSGIKNWRKIVSSSDGTKLAAVVDGGYIYTSNDSGATWTEQTGSGSRSWRSVTSSSDGTKLAAVVYNGYIYTSNDSGATWTEQTGSGSRYWRSIASSPDGIKLFASVSIGYIYTSTDSGVTWTEQTSAGSRAWLAVASSSDGTKLAAVVDSGYVYTSTDSGSTWIEQTGSGVKSWYSITSSLDGTKIIAGTNYGAFIYKSTDSGSTWSQQSFPGSWYDLASSSDGAKIVSVSNGGYIYTYTPIKAPVVYTNGSNATSATTVTLNGYVNTSHTTHGFEYGLTTSYGTTVSTNGTYNLGSYTSSSITVTPGVTYHYRAYATNSQGTTYSADSTFVLDYQTWTQQTNAGSRNWYDVASSSDGTKLAAVVDGGYIYTSNDSGATWTEQTGSGSRSWRSITSSSDGTKLAAVVSTGYIYTSTDSGVTWTQQTNSGSRAWYSITSSSDGTKLAAVHNGGYIYTSIDSGVTWVVRTNSGSRNWYSITSSSDGAKLAAVVYNGHIYTSTDSGATWTQQVNSGPQNWYSITSSSDGTKLAAGVYGGYIYTSTDSGITWIEQKDSGIRAWKSVFYSSDGSKIISVISYGYLYVSSDGGVNWMAQYGAGSRNWYFITSSSDGTKLTAGLYGGYIYTESSSSSPTLTTPTVTNITDTSAYLGANVTSLGSPATLTARGTCWGTTSNPTTNCEAEGSTTGGVFTQVRTGLTCNTTYYYRGYATNATGTNYSPDGTFTTSACSTYAWTAQVGSGNRNWYAVTSSADGTKLAAVVKNGYIYTSADSGDTWTERTAPGLRDWRSITSSADGTKLVAVNYGNSKPYISTDSGVTWAEMAGPGIFGFYGVTSSSDGTKLALIINSGYIYTSIDSGATWTQQTASGSRSWRAIASSSDGTKLAAVVNGGYIYTSTDSGVTWTEQTASGSRGWYGISSSSDGTKLAAGVYGGYFYTSTDSGVTWTEQTASGSHSWYSVASSSDGTKLAAIYGSYIHKSTDSGATWTQQTPVGQSNWLSVASSSDGTKIAAVNNATYIYTYTPAKAPVVYTEGSNATSPTTVTLNGFVNTDHTTHGFEYGTTISYGSSTSSTGVYKVGSYTSSSITVTPGVTYHYRAYATNSQGTTYSADSTFVLDYQTWTEQTNSGQHYWSSISSSSDGTKLAAAIDSGGYVNTSTDSGATWAEQTNSGSRDWRSIASSSDGTKLAAVAYTGYIYTSTDSGATWTEQTNSGSRNWVSITSSSDGTKLAAVYSGYVYTSTDSGATWTQRTASGSRSWYSISSSSDGTKLAAVVNGGYIYTSTDSGVTWIQQNASGARGWYSISSSSDGTKLAAVVSTGYIYTSTDSGTTWIEQTNSGSRSWYGITSSSDGTKLAAVVNGGYIYTSTDSGTTWIAQTNLGTKFWRSVTSSSDGTKLAAVVHSSLGYIHTYRSKTIPVVTTSVATSILDISVTLNGNITDTGGDTVTVRGFNYGLDTSYGTNTVENGSFSTGAYTANITSLTCNTTYHFRSYATNSIGTAYSADSTFTTAACIPTLSSTTAASSITQTTASSGGTIGSNGGATITTSGVVWNTTGTPTTSDSKTTDNATSGTYTSSLTGLTCNTTYYVRAYATNSVGTGYATQVSFTTGACNVAPTITTPTSASITQTGATLGGNITSAGIPATITARGTCWATTATPRTNCLADGSTTTGVFTQARTGLTCNTTYYYAAYATNATGTTYTTDGTFTTSACPSTISISGTADGNSGATVKVAVNSTLQAQSTTISGGTWTISGVTQPVAGDIVTVWIDNVADTSESTAVTKWSSGNISGMVLNTNVLSVGSNQNASLTATNFGLYDFDNDEDIMHTLNTGVLLVQGGTNSYTGETLSILSGNTLTVASASSETLTTEKITNAGTLTFTGTPAITINGTSGTLFTNSGTFNAGNSTVSLTGNGNAVIASGFPSFYNLTINSTGTKSPVETLTVTSNLTLTSGTLDTVSGNNYTVNVGWIVMNGGTFTPQASTVNLTGNSATLFVLASGTFTAGTSNFNLVGNGSAIIASGSPSFYKLTINSTGTKSLSLALNVTNTLTISNGTLDTSNYTVNAGWVVINGGIFTPQASTVNITGTAGTLFTLSSGTFTEGNSSINLTGGGSTTISSGFPSFYSLYISGGGTKTLNENLLANGTIVINAGTILNTTTNNYSINSPSIQINTGTLNLNNSVISLSGTSTVFNYLAGTINAGTSTIKLTNSSSSSKTFNGGGQTYNNLWLAPGTGTGSFTITGSNTFNNFKDDGTAAHSVLFTAGTTQTVSSWNVSGTAGNLITINSTTTGTHSLVMSGGAYADSDYLNIQHSVVTPANTWYAGDHSTNNQAVATAGSGWIFTARTIASTYDLSGYRVYKNIDNLDLSEAISGESSSTSLSKLGDSFRLRLLMHIGVDQLLLNAQNFKLQYSPRAGACDSSFVGETYQDVTAATSIAYYDNPSLANYGALTPSFMDPSHSSHTIVNQSYVESNNFTNSIAAIPSGQDGLWDFSLYDQAQSGGAAYCFRVVKSDGSLLDSYSQIPEIIAGFYVNRRGGGGHIESVNTPSGNTGGGTNTGGGGNTVLPFCSDGIDNDGDTLIDTLDPQCHLGGILGNAYVPTHNSEVAAPVINTGGSGGGGGAGGLE